MKIKDRVDGVLAKVQAHPKAEPIGKALSISGKILTACGGVVPVLPIVGGALSLGSELLNNDPTMKDLHNELNHINEQLQNSSGSEYVTKALEKATEEIEEKIQDEFRKNQTHMEHILKEVSLEQKFLSEDIKKIKDTVEETFKLVTDLKYKVFVY